jgi:hypothetical protein
MGLVNTTTTPTAISPVPMSLTILPTRQRLLFSSGGNEKFGKVHKSFANGKSSRVLHDQEDFCRELTVAEDF